LINVKGDTAGAVAGGRGFAGKRGLDCGLDCGVGGVSEGSGDVVLVPADVLVLDRGFEAIDLL
jgi:hypothetical protein